MVLYPLNGGGLERELRDIGCDRKSFPLFLEKSGVLPVKIKNVKAPLASIIKQEMISSKGDAAVHASTITCGVELTDVILLGTVAVYRDFIGKLARQDYPTLNEVRDLMERLLKSWLSPVTRQVSSRGRTLDYGRTLLMGVLNLTSDSFYSSSRISGRDEAVRRCAEMLEQGADIIDIGGESTRPGAEPVPLGLEMERVLPVVEWASKNLDVALSVDTYKSAVAEEALKAGADMINDISGLGFDDRMAGVVKKYGALAVIMHIKGVPGNMQQNPQYEDVLAELTEYFEEKLGLADKDGIRPENLIIDPGVGFGKRLEDNIRILNGLAAFKKFGLPVMVGASRKSMVGALLGKVPEQPVPPEDRLFGTLGAHAAALLNGASILRVHDVKEHWEMCRVMDRIHQVGFESN